MRLERHDILFEQLQIRGKTFRNRFYAVPHALFPTDRRASEVAFRRMKAEGGWAAVCGGIISLRIDNWDGLRPRIWDSRDRAVLAETAAAIHGEGALAGIELGFGGAHRGGKFHPPLGPSQIPDPAHPLVVPKAMDLDDIRRVQDDWVDAARTAAKSSFDIVYAYGGSGYLPAQFLSPHFNRRCDPYGGSLENRARFWLELLEGFRGAVGEDAIVAVRIAAEPFSSLGVPLEDVLDFVRLADDLVDLWDVNVGWTWSPDSASSRVAAEGYQVEWSGQIRRATNKPIVGVGRLTNPDRMAEIIRSGVWDFVGGARPSIADPFLPRKIEEGRYDDIRECTGANFCIASELRPSGLGCVQNATIGEEHRRGWHPERFEPARDKLLDVLVVGAGPAGLECSLVLGRRGFRRVHLVDAAPGAGGHLLDLTRLPGLGELARIVNHRIIQLGKLANVELLLGTRLEPDDVREYGADLVVLATGSHWARRDETGDLRSASVEVFSPDDILAGKRPEGDVVIADAEGSAMGAGLAELLAEEGRRVQLCTVADRAAPSLDATFEGKYVRESLHKLGVEVVANRTLVEIDGNAFVFEDAFGELEQRRATGLVLVTHRVSDDDLFRAVSEEPGALADAGIRRLLCIGDCVAPRELGLVISDAHRLGRELDSKTPETPAEALREVAA